MIRPARSIRTRQSLTLVQLLSLSLAPLIREIKRKKLQAEVRSLSGLAEYFEWQERNCRAGLADTHKRIALAHSDLNALSGRRHG